MDDRGRLLAGESYLDGVVRKYKEETSLKVAPERFTYVTTNRYIMNFRKQEPKEAGSDSVGFTFTIELTPEERAVVEEGLDSNEYDVTAGLTECSREDLLTHRAHSALVDLHDQVFSAL